MTWYIRCYDMVWDAEWQYEASEETAMKAKAAGAEAQDHPWDGVPIGHPKWAALEREAAREAKEA